MLCVVALASIGLALASCGQGSGVNRPELEPATAPGASPTGSVTFLLKLFADPQQGFLMRWVAESDWVRGELEFQAPQRPVPADWLLPGRAGAVHRYDPAARAFVPSNLSEWDALDAPAWRNGEGPRLWDDQSRVINPEHNRLVGKWWISKETHARKQALAPDDAGWDTLSYQGVEFKLPEPHLENTSFSPCARYQLVLMRDGQMAGSAWGPGKNPTGYLYAVIYSSETGQPVTDVYRVGHRPMSAGLFGWTVDSRYAIIKHSNASDGQGELFYILPNPELTSTKPRVKGGG